MSRGKFVVFEGIDNSGKTTIATKVRDWLETQKIDSILTKHPGSTVVGQSLRQILKHSDHPMDANSQGLMFATDNSLFINQILKPNLEVGHWVLGDRNNFISSIAYQVASGCDPYQLDVIHQATGVSDDARIDVLFIFQCSWENAQARKAPLEGPDRYEDQGRSYFDALTNIYDSMLVHQGKRLSKFISGLENVHYIDANKPAEDVFNNIKDVLEVYLRRDGQQEED